MDCKGREVARAILISLSSAKLARADECIKMVNRMSKVTENAPIVVALSTEALLLRVEANVLSEEASKLADGRTL